MSSSIFLHNEKEIVISFPNSKQEAGRGITVREISFCPKSKSCKYPLKFTSEQLL